MAEVESVAGLVLDVLKPRISACQRATSLFGLLT